MFLRQKHVVNSLMKLAPDFYICSASAQKAELNVVGVLEVMTWSGAGVSVLVYRRGAAFEMDWWWFGVFQLILQYYTVHIISLRACMFSVKL